MHTTHITEPTQEAIAILMHPETKLKTYHLFVYGSLKHSCHNHISCGMYGCKFVHKHHITGHRIKHAGAVPFIERTGDVNDITQGEIYIIPEDYKEYLDTEVERGYTFTEIEKGIYCYVPDFDTESFEEIPVNHSGFYEWTPRLELTYETNPNIKREIFYAQGS